MKKLFAGLIALSCLSGSVLTAHAESQSDAELGLNSTYTIEGENFTFEGSKYPTITPMPDGTVPTLLITGVFSMGEEAPPIYTVICLNEEDGHASAYGIMHSYKIAPFMENAYDLDVGDLVYMSCFPLLQYYYNPPTPDELRLLTGPSGHYRDRQGNIITSGDDIIIECIGYGPDVYGSDFTDIMLREAIWDPGVIFSRPDGLYSISKRMDAILSGDIDALLNNDITDDTEEETSGLQLNPVQPTLAKGDASGDDDINILDVIAINRAVLGKAVLDEEQTKAADLDGNGVVDAADSLILLKYLIGLVDAL